MDASPGASHPWRLQRFDILPSTSDYLISEAEAGEPDGMAVLAGLQTAGRGSRGRTWIAPPGNLNLSVLLRPPPYLPATGQWALLAGLALHDALSAYTPADLQLKWPNDLLLQGRKLAGILIDATIADDGGLAWIVIGMGVNLVAAPPATSHSAAALADIGPSPSPEACATCILDKLWNWRAVLSNCGFDQIRTAWLDRAHPIGASIMSISDTHLPISGQFAGLASDGALLLEQDGQVKPYATGDFVTQVRS